MAFWPKKSESSPTRELVTPLPAAGRSTVQIAETQGTSADVGLARKAAGAAALGAGTQGGVEVPPEQRRKNAGAAKLLAAGFGEIVSLLMRSPQYRGTPLGDLEWLVAPPLLTGQFSIAEAQSKRNGLTAPVAVVLWANVSAEVDQRLASSLDQPIKLAPTEWRSGNIVWIVAALGEPRLLEAMMKQLVSKQWAGKQVKLRTRGKDGTAVGKLGAAK